MEYITTTDLRTQSSQLVQTLKKGGKVSLIHRSKIVAIIQPVQETPKTFDAGIFKRLLQDIKLPKTTPARREKTYRQHLIKKYGKHLS